MAALVRLVEATALAPPRVRRPPGRKGQPYYLNRLRTCKQCRVLFARWQQYSTLPPLPDVVADLNERRRLWEMFRDHVWVCSTVERSLKLTQRDFKRTARHDTARWDGPPARGALWEWKE